MPNKPNAPVRAPSRSVYISKGCTFHKDIAKKHLQETLNHLIAEANLTGETEYALKAHRTLQAYRNSLRKNRLKEKIALERYFLAQALKDQKNTQILFKGETGNKISKIKRERAKNIIKALKNSRKRFGERKALRRKFTANSIRGGRKNDSYGSWVRSFKAGLGELKRSYSPIDLIDLINKYSKENNVTSPQVLEIGAGVGNAARGLKERKDSIKVTATGLKWLKEWKPHTENGIRFKVLHAQNLSRKIKPSSVDIIHSNLGFAHAFDLTKAFMEARKVLKKGGFLLFTAEKDLLPNGAPKGFELVTKREKVYAKEDADGIIVQAYPLHVFLLRKK